MMKFVLVAVFAGLYCFTSSCRGVKTAEGAVVKQGVSGAVFELVGNQMPSPDLKNNGGKPLITTIYVYELTNLQQLEKNPELPYFNRPSTRLVSETISDTSGRFAISLPVGRYSLFIERDGKLYANNFDQYNNILPVSIEKNKLSSVNITVTDKAAF